MMPRLDFQSLCEFLPDAVVVTDIDGIITGANARAAALFGYERGELLGKEIETLVPDADRERHRDHRRAYYRSFVVRPMGMGLSLRGRRKDGSELPLEISLSPIETGDGKQVISVIHDISERLQLEEAMRESEERYRSLVELSPEAIIVHTLGKILYVNEATLKLFLASSREELMGRSFLEFVPPEYIPEVLERMQESAEQLQQRGPLRVKARRIDGQEFYIESIVSRFTYRGQPAAQVILRDITERVRAEQELNESREQLRKLSTHLQSAREAERTSIAREIHDELGGALTALKFDLASFEDALQETDIRRAVMEKVDDMAQLIDSTVKTMRRIITELRPVLLDSLGLSAAIEWYAEDFQSRTGIACHVVVPTDDISPEKDRATALYRIFQETLTNVARHANATRVDVNMQVSDGWLCLTVQDNGGGITREQAQHSGSFGILGMRERALIFGGEVSVQGAAGEGTTVSVRLPYHATHAEREQ